VLLSSWVFWVLLSVMLHELAHGWAALSQGDDTPRIYGRMTPNPVVHMGWLSLILLVLTGIAWGMMPTDPSKYRWGRRGRIIVSGAGPAMNVVLWLICWTAFGVAIAKYADDGTLARGLGAIPDGTEKQLATFFLIGGSLNGMLARDSPAPTTAGCTTLASPTRASSSCSLRCSAAWRGSRAGSPISSASASRRLRCSSRAWADARRVLSASRTARAIASVRPFAYLSRLATASRRRSARRSLPLHAASES
jgi:hypothetical protein